MYLSGHGGAGQHDVATLLELLDVPHGKIIGHGGLVPTVHVQVLAQHLKRLAVNTIKVLLALGVNRRMQGLRIRP